LEALVRSFVVIARSLLAIRFANATATTMRGYFSKLCASQGSSQLPLRALTHS